MAIKQKSKVYPRDIEESNPTKKPYTIKYRRPVQNMYGLIKYLLSICDPLKIIPTK